MRAVGVALVVFGVAAGCGGAKQSARKVEAGGWSPFDAKVTALIEPWLRERPDERILEATRARLASSEWARVQVDRRDDTDERAFIDNKDAGSMLASATMSWDRGTIPKALSLQLRALAIDKVRQWLLELAPRHGGRYFEPTRDTYSSEQKPATALLPTATVQVRRAQQGTVQLVIGLRRYPDELFVDLAPSRFSAVRNRWHEPPLRQDERKRARVELDKLTAVAEDKSPTGIANPTWKVAGNAVSFIMHAPGLYGAELAEVSAALVALPRGSWDAALVNHLGPLLRDAGCAKQLEQAYRQPRNTRAAFLAGKCEWRGKRSLGASAGRLALWQVALVAAIDYLADERGVARWPMHERVRRSLLTPGDGE